MALNDFNHSLHALLSEELYREFFTDYNSGHTTDLLGMGASSGHTSTNWARLRLHMRRQTKVGSLQLGFGQHLASSQ